MFILLTKDVEFQWDSNFQLSFETRKQKLSTTLVLRGPNLALYFHICANALDTTLGGLFWAKERIKFPMSSILLEKISLLQNKVHVTEK